MSEFRIGQVAPTSQPSQVNPSSSSARPNNFLPTSLQSVSNPDPSSDSTSADSIRRASAPCLSLFTLIQRFNKLVRGEIGGEELSLIKVKAEAALRVLVPETGRSLLGFWDPKFVSEFVEALLDIPHEDERATAISHLGQATRDLSHSTCSYLLRAALNESPRVLRRLRFLRE